MKIEVKLTPQDGASEPVTFADVQANSRISSTSEQTLIEGYITTARRYAEQYCQTAFIDSDVVHYATDLDRDEPINLELTYGPVTSVDAVTRIDYKGNETVLTLNEDFYLQGNERKVVLVNRNLRSGVGYGLDQYKVEYAVEADVPQGVKDAILKIVDSLWHNRGNESDGNRVSTAEAFISGHALLQPYRQKVWI